MNRVALLFVANIPAIICCSISGYLVMHNTTGWGWFLFVGLLCSHSVTTEKEGIES